MRDERPRNAGNAGEAGQRTGGEFWQLAVVTRRQVVANQLQLSLDDVVVVDEPLRGRRDGTARRGGAGDLFVGFPERPGVLAHATRDRVTAARRR